MPNATRLSEFDLIKRFFVRESPSAVLGPGDDCALLAPAPGKTVAITTDMLVSGVHFFPDTDPWQLGWKTVAVNLSDLAAMGATPRWILLAMSLPEVNLDWLTAFSDGLFACTKTYGVALVGGDTTQGSLNFCVTALGDVPLGAALRRDSARVGDEVWVSGVVGLAALGLAHLQGKICLSGDALLASLSALQKPLPRVQLGLALQENQLAHAAIDVSDGLLADLAHIATASKLAIELHLPSFPALPDFSFIDDGLMRACQRTYQLSGGDDYELAFTASSDKHADILALSESLALPLTQIGHVIPISAREKEAFPVYVRDENGALVSTVRQGFDHFA